ncbi:hypothetical protein FRACYDRAFT_254579 [Fragilariopsis cylindrus CCMP1102]|uniref:Uncharacterized protein n=1 Tax=Fragilariopsis cylindrus CCMP1102 TaxID=635003 RepID=A0A1E7EKP9_9STRA|nr:hypothetical protein FRACYDRAFT_254579 [Fragilariopsis cylindrus CCMP1102]|eukprot:OEU06417.1 hypothetical protein FRACYDRAFT_254579 [Fragilariopsis cylindrus CCMP1102]
MHRVDTWTGLWDVQVHFLSFFVPPRRIGVATLPLLNSSLPLPEFLLLLGLADDELIMVFDGWGGGVNDHLRDVAENPHLKGENPMNNVGIETQICAVATALIDYE